MRFPLEELRRLYLDEGLTPVAIARHYECSEGTIRAALIRARIPLRNLSQARRLMFGIEIAKAYLIGLRQGDLRVALGKAGRQSQTIRVEVSSTRAEQLALFRELFAPYGHVWEGRVRDSGRRDLVCHLNFTFDFLLPKKDRVDDWIFLVDENMAAFASGYVDAEGSFGFNKGDPHFSIDSYDSGILRALHRWFERCGVAGPAPHIVRKKGSYNSGAGVPYSKDVWRLAVYRQRALCNLIDLIRPFVRHAKRRKDMEQVWAIVNQKDG